MTATIDATDTAFIRAICESPADDAPRLIYADWLEETARDVECDQPGYDDGEPHFQCPTCDGSGVVSDGRRERAEFIRVQCELALFDRWCHNADFHVQTPRGVNIDELRRRERELLAGNNRRWFHGCPGLLDVTDSFTWDYRRGFISHVTCSVADWLRHGRDIVQRQPVERVTISDKRPGRFSNMIVWYGSAHPNSVYTLPLELWGHLRNARDDFSQWTNHYPTEADALDAISDACLCWARP